MGTRNIYVTEDGCIYQDVRQHAETDVKLDVTTDLARIILVSEPMRITHFGEQLAAMSARRL